MASLRQAAARQFSRQRRTLFTSASSPPSSPLRTGLYATAFTLSAGLFAVYYFDARSALHRYLLAPVLRYTFDAETGHQIAVKVLKSGLGPKDPLKDDERLKCELWGKSISSPVGLAAGFDKDGEAIDGLFDLGFSWVEIGSVTPNPQPGNPKPRIFHLPEDQALVNRMGFPSQGHMVVLSRIRARIPAFPSGDLDRASFRPESMLVVNLGKNKDSPLDSIDDFVAGVKRFGPYSDVLVVNVSSPNTPGLRGLQNKDALESLLRGVAEARDQVPNSPKLVVKLAPDLDEEQLIDIASVIRESKIDGVIMSNTTIARPAILRNANKVQTGGLSGTPLKDYSLRALKTLRRHLPSSIPLIGCGGVSTGDDALEYARAGASMVQMYTGFGYDGAGACRRIKDQIVERLKQSDQTWGDVVKKAVDELSWTPPAPVAEVTVAQLTKEAEDLKKLLNEFANKISGAPASASPVP